MANKQLGNALQGGLAGAGTGASVGGPWGAVIGGAIGIGASLLGGSGDETQQQVTRVVLPETELERQATGITSDQLGQYQDYVNAGPGLADIQGGMDASSQLAALLQNYSTGGYLPSQQDFNFANSLTQSVFAPQQLALQQGFQDAQVQANRQAALMGRSGNDPILMNKLLQEQTRQQAALQAQMTSYSAQQAQQMPMQRLSFLSQFQQLKQGLASQALANRQALVNMGANIKTSEQNFRNGVAGTNMTTQSSGGMDGLASAMALGGSAAKLYGMFNTPSTTPTTTPVSANNGAAQSNFAMPF